MSTPVIDNQIKPNNVTQSTISQLELNCKSPSGQVKIKVSTLSTVGQLADAVSSTTGIPRTALSLCYGYPPKRINLDASSCGKLLSEAQIYSGENILADYKFQVEELKILPSKTNNNQNLKSSVLTRLIAPSDNCCLFTSVHFCVSNLSSTLPINTEVVTDFAFVNEMRYTLASIVLSDPITFNEGILGMHPFEYSESIVKPDRWGGGIEVSILSQINNLEIDVVDVISGRIDKFGEDKAYSKRILLLYDGIHYDPLAMMHVNTGTLQTIFSTSIDEILIEAQDLAYKVHQTGQFTDLANFNIMCSICRAPLRGQKDAQEHAKLTNHTQFQERVGQ